MLKIKTEDGTEDIVNFRNQTDGYDYMEMKVGGGKSVNVGESVDMSCSSGDRISKCYFFRPGGKVRYEVGPGDKFYNGRIGCLCDHDATIEATKVCSLRISRSIKDDSGDWRCEVLVRRNGKIVTLSAVQKIAIKGEETNDIITPPPITPPPTTTLPPIQILMRLPNPPKPSWNVGNAADILDLTSSAPITLRGISLLGSKEPGILNGQIRLKQGSQVLSSSQFTYPGPPTIYHDQFFDVPVTANPGIQYSIELQYHEKSSDINY